MYFAHKPCIKGQMKLAELLSNKEIANKLHISTHTVISHRKNISQKTGIKSVTSLTIIPLLKTLFP
jgi:DNA-binding NarL/FixJ family response regulator